MGARRELRRFQIIPLARRLDRLIGAIAKPRGLLWRQFVTGARQHVLRLDARHRGPHEVGGRPFADGTGRSEEHTSELPSLMRISYAVFCLQTHTYTS